MTIGKGTARADVTEAGIGIAIARGKAYEQDPFRPRAIAVRYCADDDTLALRLASGVELAIPRKLLQGLADANPSDVAKVQLEDDGTSLHWESLDVDHYVPGLIDGVFGTRKWMSEAGKIGGASRSEAKRTAARKNGRKGGRPRKARA